MRRLLALLGITALAVLPAATVSSFADEQIPVDPTSIPQFVDPLPNLTFVDGTHPVTLTMCEFKAHVLSTGTFEPGVAPETWVWGYIPGASCPSSVQDTYINPVIVAQRGTPTAVTYVNNLGDSMASHVLAYRNSTDQTLHWADPLNKEQNGCNEERHEGMPPTGECAQNYDGPIPAVAHLHGGEVPADLDGGPDAWFTSDGSYQGHAYYSFPGTGGPGSNMAVYRYPNEQEPALIWFHDHTLGATRLNVYAGLAGAYLLTDPADSSIPTNFPPAVPVVLQDRMFDKQGQLYFPAGYPSIPNPDHPFWVPEFSGDTVAVNGHTWPYLEVEAKRYRLLFINGSNARTYELFLTDQDGKTKGPAMWQIGTDGGYLDYPVKIDPAAPGKTLKHLVLMPGERADVIVDFAGLAAGTRLLLRNIAKTPYPAGDTVNGKTVDTSYDPALGGALRTPMVRLVDPTTGSLAPDVTSQLTRQLTLNEVLSEPSSVDGVDYEGGPDEVLVNNTMWSGLDEDGSVRPDFTPITVNGVTIGYSELPQEGETEIWEIVNMTADAHPIHLHLVQFQLLSRQKYDARKYLADYETAFGGTIIHGEGPPNDYNVPNGDGAVGGNPAVGPYLRGAVKPPDANEAGWKDTVRMLPGEVTRIAVRWAPTSEPASTPAVDAFFPFSPDGGHGYVWHCHIIDHEDNEMMRPTSVQPNGAATRTYIKGVDY